ncbi:MAG: hypothetical protein Q7R66_08005 [Undibacterium sp.]|uniref:hypothetical protein n=1 Tax=Undibacterium sp. TaxID=1914977 RepID=UPI00272577AB|nr:hypothetical protein [Undibacterium sp.]MDO8652118.1 hypothetical protein [Undibacterium sp.]
MKLYRESPADEQTRSGEVHLHIRFRPGNLIGILLVLLIHGLLLYFILHVHPEKKEGNVENAQPPIVLMLDKTTVSKMAKGETKKSPPKPIPPARPKKAITPPVATPSAIVSTPSPTPPPVANALQAVDMSSMLAAARERRRVAEESVAQENEAARQASRGMSPQEVAEANVKRSMQQANGREGTNGVFQILSKSTRMASFSFRGWKPGANNSWRQVIEVDAGLGGDVELAIVRRMIELIRTHYTGDFSWDSHRVGHVVTLSARPKDSAELESFMMKEFFGGA